ncbi:MAG: hypothetical protein ACR2RL_21750 [Gammaproteobacteria bacterium]
MKRKAELLLQTPRLPEHEAELAAIDAEMAALATEVGNKEALITLLAKLALEQAAHSGLSSPTVAEVQTKMARFEASPLKNDLLTP